MLAVEAHLEILNLYARYSHLVDGGRAAEWSQCFTRDGALEVPVNGIEARGHEALAAFGRGYFERAEAMRRPRKHIFTNILVDGDDAQASGACYLMLIVGGAQDAHPSVLTTGRYEDTLVHTQEGWRFQRRVLHVDAP